MSSSYWRRIVCARAYRMRPAVVGVTPETERSKSFTFNSCSRTASCWLSAGWATPVAAAALVILRLSTICTKYRKRLVSTREPPFGGLQQGNENGARGHHSGDEPHWACE